MFTDTWAWMNDFHTKAVRDRDKDRQRLSNLNQDAGARQEKDPQQAKILLEQGYDLAQRLGEKWWIIYFEMRICMLYHYYFIDYKSSLEMIVKTTVEIQKPDYAECPLNSVVYLNLVKVYLVLDPIGYEAKIREALYYLETEVQLDKEIWQTVPAYYSNLASAFDQTEKALTAALLCLERCEGSAFRSVKTCFMLCTLNWTRDNLDEVNHFAQLGETYARRNLANLKQALATLLLWQAICRQKAGDEAEAKRFYITATTTVQELESLSSGGYRGVLSIYHETCGDLQRALKIREQWLEIAGKSGSPHSHTQAHLSCCRLLAKMSLLRKEHLAAARDAAKELIDPSRFLAKLEKYQASPDAG